MAAATTTTPAALTVRQVMERLCLKDCETVYRLFRDGRLRGTRIGRLYRIDPASVDELIAGPLPAAGTTRRPRVPKVSPGRVSARLAARQSRAANGRD